MKIHWTFEKILEFLVENFLSFFLDIQSCLHYLEFFAKIGLSFFEASLEFFENGQKTALTYYRLFDNGNYDTLKGCTQCPYGKSDRRWQPGESRCQGRWSSHLSSTSITSVDGHFPFPDLPFLISPSLFPASWFPLLYLSLVLKCRFDVSKSDDIFSRCPFLPLQLYLFLIDHFLISRFPYYLFVTGASRDHRKKVISALELHNPT